MPTQTPRVLMAAPTRGAPKMQFMQSVIGTIKDLARRGIESDFHAEPGSDLVFQRSILASRFLDRPEQFTHLFSVDDYMAFPADLCSRLLGADKSLVGTICSRRTLHVDQIEKAVSDGLPVKQAILASHEWIVSGAQSSDNGLCKVENIGFGAVLMRRDVFETMIGKKTVGRFGGQGIQFYGFFARRPQDAAVAHIAEDRSFYRRWQHDCGGEVWALADAQIMHIGDFMYGGSYTDVPSSHRTTV
jgi:hypothetical protein